MTQIKSEKAKGYININFPHPSTDDKEMVQVITKAIIIAETEAEERHAKVLQELKDKAVEAFCDCCDRYDTIVCCNQDNCNYIKQFTQKLNEK